MRIVLIKHDPGSLLFTCVPAPTRVDDPVFYLLSANADTDQQEWAYPCFTCFLHTLCDQQVAYFDLAFEAIISAPHFCFSSRFPCGEHLRSTSLLSRGMASRVGVMSTILRLSFTLVRRCNSGRVYSAIFYYSALHYFLALASWWLQGAS